jgi:hypothetical protein
MSSSSIAAPGQAGSVGSPAGRELGLALLLVAAALLLRSLGLVYSVMNYDESLYILMGSELAKGHLPFTTLCDLKPFGLFALFGVFTSLPFDGVVTSRIAASLVVGLTGYALSASPGCSFEDEDPGDRVSAAWLRHLLPGGWRTAAQGRSSTTPAPCWPADRAPVAAAARDRQDPPVRRRPA